jgi:hypothetical protein
MSDPRLALRQALAISRKKQVIAETLLSGGIIGGAVTSPILWVTFAGASAYYGRHAHHHRSLARTIVGDHLSAIYCKGNKAGPVRADVTNWLNKVEAMGNVLCAKPTYAQRFLMYVRGDINREEEVPAPSAQPQRG